MLFIYSWHEECVKEKTVIYIYGIDELNQTVCLIVENFKPYVYLELPPLRNWKEQVNLNTLTNTLITTFKSSFHFASFHLQLKHKLYGSHLDLSNKKTKFWYLKCFFHARKHAYYFNKRMQQALQIPTIGTLFFRVHELQATPILQLSVKYNLPMTGWIEFTGDIEDTEQLTHCNEEYIVDLTRHKLQPSTCVDPVYPLILGWDIETNSEDPLKFPNANKPNDVVFQISCAVWRLGDSTVEKYLLSLGTPDVKIVGSDTDVITYKEEYQLILGFAELVNRIKPHVLVGYNVFNFDYPYLLGRSKLNRCLSGFLVHGFLKDTQGEIKDIKWSSSAYKNQVFNFIECHGRISIDLLPVIQRDYKMNSYSLKAVSEFFLQDTKDDLDAKGIFKCYRMGMNIDTYPVDKEKGDQALGICGKYCVKDSVLVDDLFNKLGVWFSLSEMSKTCVVPMMYLFTKGQQIKVYNQLYKYCSQVANTIVEKVTSTIENKDFSGAFVIEPKPSLVENVLPFDFKSLYPSLIIAYNIDYTTFVSDPSIPDDLCHVMEWDDHINCEHDPKIIEKLKLTEEITRLRLTKTDKARLAVAIKQRASIKISSKAKLCEHRKFRFLKEPKGVLPTIIQNLLDSRENTRREISKLKKKLATTDEEKAEIDFQIKVLHHRQLSYKVSANSMYGITGVSEGMLPFLPIAMSVTFKGRQLLQQVSQIIKTEYNGDIIYGDTDSNYVCFPNIKEDLWSYAQMVAREVSEHFPDPISLEFEEVKYSQFLILSKKRYMYKSCDQNEIISDEIGKKGVLLSRRDNSKFVRDVYTRIIEAVFDKKIYNDIVQIIVDATTDLYSKNVPYADFVITKSIGDYGDGSMQVTPKDNLKGTIGTYTVPLITKEEASTLTPKQVADWYLSKLPAHIQLLEKIKRRGHLKDEGGRLEYVITKLDCSKSKQCDSIESYSYFIRNSNVLKIDHQYYLDKLLTPTSEVFEALYPESTFIKDHLNLCLKIKPKLMKELNDLFSPKLIIGH